MSLMDPRERDLLARERALVERERAARLQEVEDRERELAERERALNIIPPPSVAPPPMASPHLLGPRGAAPWEVVASLEPEPEREQRRRPWWQWVFGLLTLAVVLFFVLFVMSLCAVFENPELREAVNEGATLFMVAPS